MKKIILLMVLLSACSSGPSQMPEGTLTPELSIPQTSCAKSESIDTTPTYTEWRGVGFNLPYCWGVQTGYSQDGQIWVNIAKTENGKNTHVIFYVSNPVTKDYSLANVVQINGAEATHYVYGDSNIYVIKQPVEFFMESNAPEDADVKIIFDSITFLDA